MCMMAPVFSEREIRRMVRTFLLTVFVAAGAFVGGLVALGWAVR